MERGGGEAAGKTKRLYFGISNHVSQSGAVSLSYFSQIVLQRLHTEGGIIWGSKGP